MEKYIAILLYECTSSSPKFTVIYEEITLLIEAGSQEEAEEKAANYAKKNQPGYKNKGNDDIKWKFLEIDSVNLILEEIKTDITPINSRYFKDLNAYRKFREMLGGDD